MVERERIRFVFLLASWFPNDETNYGAPITNNHSRLTNHLAPEGKHMSKPVVALVGRPNVGKSSLFNRLIRKKVAIVDNMPGVTRDRNYAETQWDGRDFVLVDTGGYVARSEEGVDGAVRDQARQAIEEADLVLFLVDAQVGIVDLDAEVARILQRGKRMCLLVVNKVDRMDQVGDMAPFYRLGLGDPIPVSAVTGLNSGDLLDELVALLPEEEPEEEAVEDEIGIALVGRPNVGKSSLLNKFVREERAVVDEVPGTTRDAIDTLFEHEGQRVRLIDTAGLHRRSKKEIGVGFYAFVRTLRALERCDVALVMLDASEGIFEQDKRIVAEAIQLGKGVVLVANKWDLVEKDSKTMNLYLEALGERMPFAEFAPTLFTSALTGQRVTKVLDIALRVAAERGKRVPTHPLNVFFENILEEYPPPKVRGRDVRGLYVTQRRTAPPTLVVFFNRPEGIPASYLRFLERRLRETFGFEGVPIRIEVKGRK